MHFQNKIYSQGGDDDIYIYGGMKFNSGSVIPRDSIAFDSKINRGRFAIIYRVRVLCGETEMLMSLIYLSASKFNNCCFLKHSIIKLPDLNLASFLTSPAQPIVCGLKANILHCIYVISKSILYILCGLYTLSYIVCGL
jgi:hypothetical protein